MADLLIFIFVGVGKIVVDSFLVLGALAYGIMLCFAFAQRILALVSDRRNAYDRLSNAHKELESIGPLKQLGESAAIVNHEIKNYMFTISAITDQIRRHEPLTIDGKEQIEDLSTTVARLSSFSQDVLSLSRAQILADRKQIELRQLVSGCIARHFSRQKDYFHLQHSAVPIVIEGDEAKLEQALVNLFSNSIEAASSEPLQVDIRLCKKEDKVVLEIEDNGIGCTEDQLKNLFTAFYTTKKGGKGTGLGLTIVQTIMQAHGGQISAYSKNSPSGAHGMGFRLSFPVGIGPHAS